MNLGLGTLDELKRQLLHEGLREQTTYDSAIAALGRGVAARFEQFCNRKFERVEGDTFDFSADREHVVLPRYPIETISAVALRDTINSGWVDQGNVNALVDTLRESSGMVHFASPLGTYRQRARITYTGGFWFDASADGSVEDVRRSVQQGVVPLTEGDESKAVVFAEEFDAENDEIVVTLSLVLPSGGMATTVNPSEVTSAGFTAIFGFPIQGEGYSLRWVASVQSATAIGSDTMPDGATARPADLFLAWLLQCEHAWGLRDKLGIAVAQDPKGVSPELIGLSRLALVPEVEGMLRPYVRYALT